MTEQDISRAYFSYLRHYPFRDVDTEIECFKNATPSFGWIKRARKALMLSAKTVAKRLEVTPSAYLAIEAGEFKGRATLQALVRVAEALDCDLVYAIRPKGGAKFSEVIWQQAYPTLVQGVESLGIHPNHKVEALGSRTGNKLNDPKFREERGWVKRRF